MHILNNYEYDKYVYTFQYVTYGHNLLVIYVTADHLFILINDDLIAKSIDYKKNVEN